jgi:hypothetical protein
MSAPVLASAEPTVIDLGRLRRMFARGLALLTEVVAVPALLLYLFVAAGHPMLGIVAVFCWRSVFVGGRVVAGVRVPMTCWFAFGLFLARTIAGLLVSSVSLYLLVPIVLCAAQGVFFIGSGIVRRPVLMHLAADYLEAMPDRPVLRRLFGQLSGIWGGAHLACAGLGLWALTLSSTTSVAVTGVLGLVCTLTSVGGCVGWGLWRVGRIPGLRIVCGSRPEAVPSARPDACVAATRLIERAAA